MPLIMSRLSCRVPLFLLVSALLLAGLFLHAAGAPDLLLKVGWHEEKLTFCFPPFQSI